MSRSYRTQKESALAARRVARDHDGAPVLPRIIQRKPCPGDIYPFEKAWLRNFLSKQPLESHYGLRAIELRARQGAVGQPFATYRPKSKTILIYSVPPVWIFTSLSGAERHSLRRFRALVEDQDGQVVVSWPNPDGLLLWFLYDVLAHELGHHFRSQYAHKNGPIGRAADEEAQAEIASVRAFRAMVARLRSKAS